MTTPLTTIADALIDFILSLLHDPAAMEEFDKDPEGVLASRGLGDACVADVKAVAPVVVDRPEVQPTPPSPPGPPSPPTPPSVVKEIHNITNSFHVDNRATIVDQSVNQNIWAEGDVNQIFDQEAVVNSGDHGAAAGEDATVDNSDTDVTVGDVSIGNDETTTTITDSFTDDSTTTDTDVTVDADNSFNDESTDVDVDVAVDDSFNDTTTTDVTNDVDVSNEGNVYSDDATVVAYEEPAADEQY